MSTHDYLYITLIHKLNDVQINIAESRNSIMYVITKLLKRSFEIFHFKGTSFDFRSVLSNYVLVQFIKKQIYFSLIWF
jgi:hypothetical protein